MKKLVLCIALAAVTSFTATANNRFCDREECLRVFDNCVAAGNSGLFCYGLYIACARGESGCSSS